jgi:hypothetical protein
MLPCLIIWFSPKIVQHVDRLNISSKSSGNNEDKLNIESPIERRPVSDSHLRNQTGHRQPITYTDGRSPIGHFILNLLAVMIGCHA